MQKICVRPVSRVDASGYGKHLVGDGSIFVSWVALSLSPIVSLSFSLSLQTKIPRSQLHQRLDTIHNT